LLNGSKPAVVCHLLFPACSMCLLPGHTRT
jgi:hypothetical protein